MTIAAAARKCLESFGTIDQISAATSPSCLAVEDGRSRYKIWASNLGTMHPETDRRSADYRLRDAPEVTSRILELLDELTEINAEVSEILSGERENRQLSSEEDDPSQDELSELHLSVGDIITSLFKVSMLVKKATKRDRYAKAAGAEGDPFLEEYDIRHVADKYPKVRSQPWLLERLGKAITQRRQYLRYSRDHKNRIAYVASAEDSLQLSAPKPAHNEANLGVIMTSRIAASTTNTPLTRPTLTPTAASTLNPGQIAQNDLEDLDGDDIASQTTSVVYSQLGAEDSGIQIPRLEDVSAGGQPFECPFCFGIVQAKRQRSWRKHVLTDLRAYVCMSQGCEAGLFEDRNSWQMHDAECHRHQWECHYCTTGTFATAAELESHLCSTHNVDDVPAEVLTEVINSSLHPLTEVAPDCPLCDFGDQVRRDVTSTGHQMSAHVQAVVPLADYYRHIAHHQEQLALFAIPPAMESSVESESRNGRSQADPDEQNQFMARWQDHVDVTEYDPEDTGHIVDTSTHMTLQPIDVTRDDTLQPSMPLSNNPQGEAVSQDAKIGEKSIYLPEEGEFPSILPQDIVYIPQQTGEQLSYRKAVYLGRQESGQHTARDWTSREEVEVSLPALIRKTNCTAEEMLEAQSLASYTAPQVIDESPEPHHYREDVTLPGRAIDAFKLKASQLRKGETGLDGYDEGFVRPIFKTFLKQIDIQAAPGEMSLSHIVRVFYATTASYCSEDNVSSDEIWKADVERGAALLMDVLIKVMQQDPDIPEEDLAQLRAEQALMVSRANDAVKNASDRFFRRYPEDLHALSEDDDRLSFEINSETMRAFKRRVQDAAAGREILPGFDDSRVQRTFSRFSKSFMRSEPARPLSLGRVMRNFGLCSSSQIKRDQKSNLKEDAEYNMHHALLLSLLISVDAQIQLERHGSAPRIRSRFTSLLMNERAKYLASSSGLRRMSQDDPSLLQETDMKDRAIDESPAETSTNLSHESSTSSVPDEVNSDMVPPEGSVVQRPPRVMRCYQCQHSWTSTLASDLTECPQCNSYSVLTKSPRRMASPDHAEATHSSEMTGEEALGKYFSERTDKYMNLYRREQSQSSSAAGSQENFPNPWSHLHVSAQKRRTTVSRTPPPTDPVVGPLSKICYTCRHRFTPSATDNADECPKCGSDFIFIDYPFKSEPLDDSTADTIESNDVETAHLSQVTDVAQVFRIIDDIEDMVAKLQQLQDRHSSNTTDVPVAVEQLLNLSAGFKRLARLQEDPQYDLGFHHARETIQVLCSSVYLTTKAALATLHVPLDETQWMMLKFRMRTVEKADVLERLRWYQAAILGLLDHLDGFTSKSLLGMDENIRSLLALQSNADLVRVDAKAETQRGTPDVIPVTGMSESQPDILTTASAPSGSATRIQPHRQDPVPSQLVSLIEITEEVATRLQELHNQHSHNTTDIPETIDQLVSLQDSIKRLSQLSAFERRDHVAFAKVQHSIQVVCQSMRYTFDDVVKVLVKTPDESRWTEWILLSIRMSDTEHVGFSERLKWYAASVMGVLNHLDGFPSAGRIFQWLGMDAKVKTLLERQESTR